METLSDDNRSRLEQILRNVFQEYRPQPTFFEMSPAPEHGLIVTTSHDSYLPVSEDLVFVSDLAQACFEKAGLSVDPYEHVSFDFCFFYYPDMHFHDTTSMGSGPPNEKGRGDVHACIFLVYQDYLTSPTYVDIDHETSSWWSYFSFDTHSTTTHLLRPGDTLVVPGDRSMKVHGCSGLGDRYLLIVYMRSA